jgi:predicted nucleic acid-binding protein
VNYLLDTNILSELVKKRPNPKFIKRLKSEPSQSLYTSGICLFELRFGSTLRDDSEKFWSKIKDDIISKIIVLPFGENEAYLAGDVLAELQKAGQTIGLEDIFVAATALIQKCVLVTANTWHYSRIKDLKIENWIK